MTASTHDQEVFSFYSDERFCNGFEEVLRRYRELVPHLRLAGLNLTYSYHLLFWIGLSLRFFCSHFCDRANIICPYHWNGRHYCWAKWRPVSCVTDNSWWAGTLSLVCTLWLFTTLDLATQTLQTSCTPDLAVLIWFCNF